jgi:glycyl-tRNA synthetase
MTNDMQKIISLCKRRGFIYPSSLIYGGMANSWDFGPLGVELLENIKRAWWDRFVRRRNDMVGLSSAIIMNPKVWEASGHIAGFCDPLIECKKCHTRHRADHLVSESEWKKIEKDLEKETDKEKFIAEKLPACPDCGGKDYTLPKNFNLMFKTFIGPAEDSTSIAYLRPETAQGMFVNFSNIISTTRRTVPFGIAQIGKSFRNEITPKNYIFRSREFEQMEIEYFIPEPKDDADWEKYFNSWQKEIQEWIEFLGIKKENINENNIPLEELAHYSKKTIDFEYHFPFGVKELYGLAYRTNFDLKNHEKTSGISMKYRDLKTGKEYIPHVIEPSFGVERTALAVLLEAYDEEKVGEGDIRTVLRLPFFASPVKVAVLPLIKNKEELVEKAKKIQQELLEFFVCDYDEGGSIGKRYRRQDEAGTPICLTIDFETLDDNCVTLRERDSMKQTRVEILKLKETLRKIIEDGNFSSLEK